MRDVILEQLKSDDREQFILDNQEAFNYGAMVEFGLRDNRFEEDGQIISRKTIERSIDEGRAYRIIYNNKKVGGIVINVKGEKGELDLLFVAPNVHGRGIGYAAWREIEKMYPKVKIWETVTPYFEQRNIHFYVNRCGFHIVEFFNKYHPDPNETDSMDNAEEDRIEEQMSPASHSIMRLLKVVSVILCSLTLLTAFYFAGYYHIFGDHMETAKISTISNHTASAPQASSTTTPADSSQRKSTKTKEANKPDDLPQTTAPAASLTPQLRPEDKYAQMEGSNYKIVGVIGTHKLQSGENLYRLAKQTYGDRDFAKYIIFFNKIENPDIITIGSVIKLPQLEKKN